MSGIDLHPEQLFDKFSCGEIEDEERARLLEHVSRCATCKFEWLLRADFAKQMREEGPDQSSVPSDVRPLARSSRMKPRKTVFAVVMATLLGVGIASASELRVVWHALIASVIPGFGSAEGREGAPPKRVALAKTMSSAVPNSEPSVVSDLVPSVSVPLATEDAPVSNVLQPTALAHAAQERHHASVDSVPASTHPSAAALFEQAIMARRGGDLSSALALSRRLQESYPDSSEARVSLATMGRLLLDQGEPRQALLCFDRYLDGANGVLEEEVRAGRAVALERLGRAEEARTAWRELLAAFPATPYAAHARLRLGVSSAP